MVRERELDVLGGAWESVCAGSGRFVAIEGEPGVGKTTLAENFLAGISGPEVGRQEVGRQEALLRAACALESAYDSPEPGTHLFGPVRADALAQLGEPAEAARSLNRFLSGPAAGGRKSALMAAARVAAEIAIARGDYDQAVRDCERARGLAKDVGLPLEIARAGLTQARAEYLRGHHAAAERTLRAARQGFAAIGATAYVRLAERRAAKWDMRVDGVLAALTNRERQVCVLAGKGLTSAVIAGQLCVDIKTIESHRTSAYRKLGVRTLAELKCLLVDGHR